MMDTTSPDIEKRRKLFLFRLCAGIIIPVFLAFTAIDYSEGDRIEFTIDVAVLLIIVTSLFSLARFEFHPLIYRTTHILITLAIFYSVSISVGKETVLYWTYIMPLLIYYFFGKREGLVWSTLFIAGLCAVLCMPWLFDSYRYDAFTISRFLIVMLIVTMIAYGLEASRQKAITLLDEKNRALALEKKNLEEAFAQIRTLSGLLPICASCKRIRDDKGYWNQLEKFFSEHSDILFSHSICPECQEKLYPEVKTIKG